jgi:hypothetical protein
MTVAIVHIDQAIELRWQDAVRRLKGHSVLSCWIALLEAYEIFQKRTPRMQLSARLCLVCGRSKSPAQKKDDLFAAAVASETNTSTSTVYYNLGYARALVERFGMPRLQEMALLPIGNDARVLRGVSGHARQENDHHTLCGPDNAEDVVTAYVMGKGKKEARAQLKMLLAKEAHDRAEAAEADEEHMQGDVPQVQDEPDEQDEELDLDRERPDEEAEPEHERVERFELDAGREVETSGVRLRVLAICDVEGNPIDGGYAIVAVTLASGSAGVADPCLIEGARS